MDRNFQRALPLVLKHEGSFVNHPADPGGATKQGRHAGVVPRLCEAERLG
ncbi:glycosyl hydrolase 108 family protein [Aminobacter sp. J15]